MVGAPNATVPGTVRAGRAFVYDLLTGNPVANLVPGVDQNDGCFGKDVDIFGDSIAFGARLPNNGVAYHYDVSLLQPGIDNGPEYTMSPSLSTFDMQFGNSVAIDGAGILVGSVRDDLDPANDIMTNEGSMYLFNGNPCVCYPADFNCDGSLDFFDFDAFIAAFNAQDPSADLFADGMFNFFDIDQFVSAYNRGC